MSLGAEDGVDVGFGRRLLEYARNPTPSPLQALLQDPNLKFKRCSKAVVLKFDIGPDNPSENPMSTTRKKEPKPNPNTDRLTGREKDILALICRDKTNSEVAEWLGIAPKTAKNLTQGLYDKIGVHRRADAKSFGLRLNGDMALPPRATS